MFSLFKKAEDQSDSIQLDSFKKEMSYVLFSSGMNTLPKPCNSIEGASGEFGLCETNPVPVNGVGGSRIYLNRLQGLSGVGVFYHRIASIQVDGNPFMVDKYHIVTSNGDLERFIYLCPYYPRRSLISPSGFRMIPWGEIEKNSVLNLLVLHGAFGSTSGPVEDFPFGLEKYFREVISKGNPRLGDSMSRQISKILEKNWNEEIKVKNDSGEYILVKRRRKIIKLL